MVQKIKKVCIFTAILAASVLLCVIAPKPTAHAGGYWDDENTSSGGGSCSGGSIWWDTCFGGTWEYYTYVNGWTGDVRAYGGGADKYGSTISSECVELGGFWSKGMLAYNANYSSLGARVDNVSGWLRRQQVGSTSKVGNSFIPVIEADSLADAGIDSPRSVMKKGSGSFTGSISESEVGARAQKYGNIAEVAADLQKAYEAGYTTKTSLGETSAFCYGPDLDGIKQEADVKAKANGQTGTVTVDSDTFTFTADHYIKRTDNTINQSITTNWSYSGHGGSSSGTVSLGKNSSWTKVGNTATKTQNSPPLGQTWEYCSTLTYVKSSRVTDGKATSPTNDTKKGCVKVYRKVSTNFTAKHSCSVTAAGQHKGNECKNYDTNSKNWSITHKGWVDTNYTGGYTVPASTTGGGASPYNFSAQKYGVAVQCARSKNPYTQYWWTADGGISDSGPTLYDTGSKDMPTGYSGNNKYFYGYTDWYDCNCEWVGTGEYDKDGKEKKKKVCHDRCRDEIWKHHYDGCGDGTTNWYDFSSSTKTKNWSENNDNNLKLPNNNDNTVSIQRCSTMKAEGHYAWNGQMSTAPGCNTITRWRRYVHFKQGTTTFKADTDKNNNKNAATTPRSDGYDLDVTNSDGRFVVTLSYAIDRTTTDNVKDTGAENLTVKNQWYSKETINPVDGSGQIYNANHEKVDGVSYGAYGVYRSEGEFSSTKANTNNVAGPKTHTISGMLYYGQKIKICGVLKYGDNVKELEDGSTIYHWTEKETNCITIHRDVKKCDQFGNAVISHQQGDNMAKIGVMNKSIGMTDYAYTTWDYNQGRINTASPNITSVWARPGDNIRYDVQYCMAANYSDAVHLIDGHPISGRNANDTNQDTKLYMKGNSEARDRFTNKVDEVRRSHYLFSKEVSTHDSIDYKNDKTIPITFPYIYRENNGIVKQQSISDSTTIGGKKSPSSSMGTTYSCPNDGVASSSSGFYQIAGKVINTAGTYDSPAGYDYAMNDRYTVNGCNSNRTQSLDVGRELSESLMWTNLSVKVSGGVSYGTYRADYASQAYVRVPYNYTAKPFLKNNSKPEGTVQIGGKMMTTPGIAVFPRKNCAFLSGFGTTLTRPDQCTGNNSYTTYATVTKPTKVTYTSYYIDDNGRRQNFNQESIVVRANTQSNLSGAVGHPTGRGNSGGPELDDDYIVDIPNNINPGNKVCIEMSITPADSHNNVGQAVVMGASLNYAPAEDTSNRYKTFWALREDGDTTAYATTCSTAVKRPTVSVEDSNLYSASNVTTSVISRWNGSKSDPKYYLFGSWSEYGIFGVVKTATKGDSVSTLGMASGASYGYNQSAYNHRTTVTGYNPLPLTVVTYNKGPKNGTYHYNYSRITAPNTQRVIVYDYATKDDGSHYYKLTSNTTHTIQPSTYTFANAPVVNASDTSGTAPSNTKICNHATQTFANNECDSGKLGSNKVGADAAKTFYESILDRYKTDTITKTDSAPKIGQYIDITNFYAEAKQFDNTDDENAALYKNVGNGKAFLGYSGGADLDFSSLTISLDKDAGGTDTYLGRTANSVIVYQADTIVINSSIIANADEKNGPNDFRMPIIIANKVWFTGTPKRIDAIIIAKEELNTCKWNDYNNFVNNIVPSFPTGKAQHDAAGNTLYTLWSNKANEMGSNVCTNELRFTAPVIVKGKLILNRTSGGGNGGDQYRRAEIFELNPATYLWSYYEMSRYSQATTTYSRELPSRY